MGQPNERLERAKEAFNQVLAVVRGTFAECGVDVSLPDPPLPEVS